MLKQRRKVGIIAVVIDDEAGVHDHRRAGVLHLDRIGVAAEARVALEQHHVGGVGQRKRGAETCGAGTDHSNLHRWKSPPQTAARNAL